MHIEMLVSAPVDATGAFDQFWSAVSAHRYGTAVVFATIILVAVIRNVAPRIHGAFGDWINSTRVSAALALVTATMLALASELMKGSKISSSLLVYGFGAGVAAIGGYNAFWDLLFPADKQKPPSLEGAEVLATRHKEGAGGASGAAQISTLVAIATLALLAFFAVLPGCATAYGTAYARCMESKGLAVANNIADQVNAILSSTDPKNATVSALENLATGAATTAVNCAVTAWLSAHPVPQGASVSPHLLNARVVAQEYLASHR